MSKKIKNTGLGKWLKAKAPKILDTVGDLLPDSGGLGIVNRASRALFISSRSRSRSN
jgi:hypothetical protein